MFRVQEFVTLISLAVSLAKTLDDSPLPPELSFITSNKTDHEQLIEECMKDYGACVAVLKVRKFCAINEDHQQRTFYTICELSYENCKMSKRVWEYMNDDECSTHPENTDYAPGPAKM